MCLTACAHFSFTPVEAPACPLASHEMNAVEIEQALSELALQPFDAAEFPYAFLAAFGNKDTTLKRLRTGNNNASDVPGGIPSPEWNAHKR